MKTLMIIVIIWNVGLTYSLFITNDNVWRQTRRVTDDIEITDGIFRMYKEDIITLRKAIDDLKQEKSGEPSKKKID